MDRTAWVEAGLYDPSAADAAEQLEVLEYLDSIGVTLEEMIAGAGTNSLHASGVDKLLASGALTGHDLAQRLGTTWTEVAELYRLLGVTRLDPDRQIFTEPDVEVIDFLRRASTQLDTGLAEEVLRALATSLTGVAETVVMMFVGSVEDELDQPGSQRERAEVSTILAEHGLWLGQAMGPLFRHHLRDAIARQRRSMSAETGRQMARLGVGFVDVVGFTSRTLEMDPGELLDFVRAFERRAYDVVSHRGGRVVKHIGDEVMFSSLDPAEACDIALALAGEFERSGSTPRGGVAYGPVLARHGDLYGPTVNLAARLADAAVPGEVLVTDATAHAATGDAISFEPAGKRQLKGFDQPVRVVSIEPR